jgi:hypothetical protein
MPERINRETQWQPFWRGYDYRIKKMGGDPESAWIERRIGKLFSYDFGQNLDILLESVSGLRDINIFEFPGGENCSSFVASCLDCGNHAIGRPGLAEWEGLPHVHETADVAPGHPGMSDWFDIAEPGEMLKSGFWMMHMSWGDPGPDVKKRLLALIAELVATGANLASIIRAYKAAPNLFRDGIKQISRDWFKIPYPYYLATHADLIWRVDYKNEVVRCIGQEAYLRQYIMTIPDIAYKMRKEPPEIIIAKPKFLYG